MPKPANPTMVREISKASIRIEKLKQRPRQPKQRNLRFSPSILKNLVRISQKSSWYGLMINIVKFVARQTKRRSFWPAAG
jgi:hypothetical protein